MKIDGKARGKKFSFALLTLLVLTVALSVGTTFGKYKKEFDEISISTNVTVDTNTMTGDPAPGEGPGIVEETPTTVYQVQPGDTLYAIAKKFHTTVEALAAYNKIESPATIRPGTILHIPPKD